MKKHTVAILGFGVVGGGVARLLTDNKEEIKNYLSCEVEIKKILDLRDFPGSPFESLIVHDFSKILSDPEIDTVIEVMGGSHPAYEFTVSALKAGKNVISSNKEVVANFGEEFLALAKENRVLYRFEAAVGGGIPVIAPLISCVKQNKIKEVRGILNGTTNYILTKMFTLGDSFESALKDAQERGYAERNPDADILGHDAARKIAILTALACGRLFAVDKIHTEGITGIRKADVLFAESIGYKIKLLGRCILDTEEPVVVVAPYLIPSDYALGGVSGVNNAVELLGEPLGSVMFYGPGAGAGATASAVVSDLAPIIAYGGNDALAPVFTRDEYSPKCAFEKSKSRSYIAIRPCELDRVKAVFEDITVRENGDELAILTPILAEKEVEEKLALAAVTPLSRIRLI